jgi:hypothetical protein
MTGSTGYTGATGYTGPLGTGPTGMTGQTGPVGQSSILTMNPFISQLFGISPAITLWGNIDTNNSTVGGVLGLEYANGVFTNTTLTPFALQIEYNLQWDRSISGFTYVAINGRNYGYSQYNGRLISNNVPVILYPGASFFVYCQNSSTGVILQTASTITITSFSAGPRGATGPTGCTGTTGATGMGVRNSVFLQPIVITGTISSPVFTNFTTNQVSYRLIGDKWRISYQMGWLGGTDAGNGDYLISLPTGLLFHFGNQYDRAFTNPIFPADYSTIATSIIPGIGGIVGNTNWSTGCYIVPYNTSQFRLVVPFSGQLETWNSRSYGVNNGFLRIEFEIWY